MAILATVTFWGLSFIASKALLALLSPLQIMVIRFAIAAIFMLVVTGKNLPLPQWEDGLQILLASLLAIPIYFFLENTGLQYTTASNASILIATIPVLNLLFGALVAKERIHPGQWVGVSLSLLGVYVLIRGDLSLAPATMRGNLMVLGAALSWVLYTQRAAPLLKKYGSVALNTYQLVLGSLSLVPLFLFEGRGWPPGETWIWLNLLYLGVLCSAVAYFCYLFALEHLGPATTTTFINLVPVVSVLGGVFILGEGLTPSRLLGGSIVVAGVVLVSLMGQPMERGVEGNNPL
ncbi:MAG: DMT family transporter [Limnochordia bacterium]